MFLLILEREEGAGKEREKVGETLTGQPGIKPTSQVRGGIPRKPGIYKKLCIYSYMFKLQSPSKYSPFDAIRLLRFFLLLKTIFELINFDAF